MGTALPRNLRERIITLHLSGKSFRSIAILCACSVSSVSRIVNLWKTTGGVAERSRAACGRKPSLSASDVRFLLVTAKRNRRKTVPQLTAEFNLGRLNPVSTNVVRKALKKVKLNGRVAARKPLLSKKNIKARLEWARKHVKWTKEQWYRVMWTDESKFELFGTKRRVYVRRFANERFRSYCLVPTVKHGGGSVMVWGAITAHGVGPLKQVVGIMRKEDYKKILVYTAVPAGLRMLKKGFVFQEDNDPKHSAIICRSYLDRKQEEGYFFLFFFIFLGSLL